MGWLVTRYWLVEKLPFGKLVDCGMVGYHEFACSPETLEWLRSGGMTSIDGSPVSSLQVMETVGENVIVKAWTDASSAHRPGTYAWQQAA